MNKKVAPWWSTVIAWGYLPWFILFDSIDALIFVVLMMAFDNRQKSSPGVTITTDENVNIRPVVHSRIMFHSDSSLI